MRLACQNNMYEMDALYELHVECNTEYILRRNGNKAKPKEETRRSAEICWEPQETAVRSLNVP